VRGDHATGASGHTDPGSRSTRRSSSPARRMFTKVRCLARGPSTVQCRSEVTEPDRSHRRRFAPRYTCCPQVCVCDTTVSADSHHGLSCHHESGRYSRHNQVNDVLCRAFISMGTLATRELPAEASTRRCNAGAMENRTVSGLECYLPVHVRHVTHQASSTKAGLMSTAVEAKKTQK
jgi:hypothetical protein